VDIQQHFDEFKSTLATLQRDPTPDDVSRMSRIERMNQFTREVEGKYVALGIGEMEWLLARLANNVPTGSSALTRWPEALFVDLVLSGVKTLDEKFLMPLVTAGMTEVDPSLPKFYIRPAVKHFGAVRVIQKLWDLIKVGNSAKQVGAIHALYWVGVPLQYPPGTTVYDIEHATPESRDEYQRADKAMREIDDFLLELFVHTTSVEVQRNIMPRLKLGNPGRYPESHRPLVDRAITIARSHRDNYFRDRLEDQLSDAPTRSKNDFVSRLITSIKRWV